MSGDEPEPEFELRRHDTWAGDGGQTHTTPYRVEINARQAFSKCLRYGVGPTGRYRFVELYRRGVLVDSRRAP